MSGSRFKIQDSVHEWDIDDDEQWLQQVEPHTTSAELNEVTVAFDVDARTLGFQWRVQCFADPGSDKSWSIDASRISLFSSAPQRSSLELAPYTLIHSVVKR